MEYIKKMEEEKTFRLKNIVIILLFVITIIILVVIFSLPWIANRFYPEQIYKGKVIDKVTNEPISFAKVKGTYCIYDGWELGLDGIFHRKLVYIEHITDQEGNFILKMKGFRHSIKVTKKYGYDLEDMFLHIFPDKKNIIIKLEPYK